MSIKEALKIITEEMRSPGEYQKAAETLREKLGESKSESDILYQQNKTLQAKLEVLRGAIEYAVNSEPANHAPLAEKETYWTLRRRKFSDALNSPNAAVKTIEARGLRVLAGEFRAMVIEGTSGASRIFASNKIAEIIEAKAANLEKRGEG